MVKIKIPLVLLAIALLIFTIGCIDINNNNVNENGDKEKNNPPIIEKIESPETVYANTRVVFNIFFSDSDYDPEKPNSDVNNEENENGYLYCDFNGDGKYDINMVSGETNNSNSTKIWVTFFLGEHQVFYFYNEAGTYNARFKLVDSKNESNEKDITIKVIEHDMEFNLDMTNESFNQGSNISYIFNIKNNGSIPIGVSNISSPFLVGTEEFITPEGNRIYQLSSYYNEYVPTGSPRMIEIKPGESYSDHGSLNPQNVTYGNTSLSIDDYNFGPGNYSMIFIFQSGASHSGLNGYWHGTSESRDTFTIV